MMVGSFLEVCGGLLGILTMPQIAAVPPVIGAAMLAGTVFLFCLRLFNKRKENAMKKD